MQRRMQRRSKRAAFTLHFRTSESELLNTWRDSKIFGEIQKIFGEDLNVFEDVRKYFGDVLFVRWSRGDPRCCNGEEAAPDDPLTLIHFGIHFELHFWIPCELHFGIYLETHFAIHLERSTRSICTQYKLKTNELSSSVLAFREW